MAAKKWVFGGYDLVFACGVMRMTFARAGDQALCELLTNSRWEDALRWLQATQPRVGRGDVCSWDW